MTHLAWALFFFLHFNTSVNNMEEQSLKVTV